MISPVCCEHLAMTLESRSMSQIPFNYTYLYTFPVIQQVTFLSFAHIWDAACKKLHFIVFGQPNKTFYPINMCNISQENHRLEPQFAEPKVRKQLGSVHFSNRLSCP